MKTRYLIAAAKDVLKVIAKAVPVEKLPAADRAAVAELRRVVNAIERDQYKGLTPSAANGRTALR